MVPAAALAARFRPARLARALRRGGHPGGPDRLGGGDRPARRGPDGDGPGQRQRRPDPGPGGRRGRRPAQRHGAFFHADQPVRPARQPGRACGARWCCSPSSTRSAPATARSSRRSSARPTRCSAGPPGTSNWWRSWPTRSTGPYVYTRAFDQQERLTGLRNWLFLTGTLGQLRQTWKNYGVAAQVLPAGGMIAHSDLVFVIDASGHTRTELNFDPGPGTSSTESSFAAELTSAAEPPVEAVMRTLGAGTVRRHRSWSCWPAPWPRAAAARRPGRYGESAVAATPPPLATAATGTSGAGWAVVEMGGAAGQDRQLLGAVRAAGREHHLAAGHPARRGRQRRHRGRRHGAGR